MVYDRKSDPAAAGGKPRWAILAARAEHHVQRAATLLKDAQERRCPEIYDGRHRCTLDAKHDGLCRISADDLP